MVFRLLIIYEVELKTRTAILVKLIYKEEQ